MTSQSTFAQSNQRRSYWMVAIAAIALLAVVSYRYSALLIESVTGYNRPIKVYTPVAAPLKTVVQEYELRIQNNPNNAENYAGLGLSLLAQVREQGDSTLFARADQAFDKALQLESDNVNALLGRAMLSASLHQFRAAVDWADKAWSLNHYKAEILGIKVDGLVELGRYDEAAAILQQMVDLRPDTSSYSRVSYLRELHGDVSGAIAAMHMAVESTPIGTESWLWTLTQLGNLYYNKGDLTQASQIYQQVLQMRADYLYANAGNARVLAAQGAFDGAITLLKPVTDRLPLPEFLILLGELYESTGDTKLANEQYDLVKTIQQLNRQAGMNVDLEMALFHANHVCDVASTVAQAQAAYQTRPTIYGADALGWAYYKAENFAAAKKFSDEALRLGTADAMLYFHAGMIAIALGDSSTARSYLEQSLTINPYFSIRDVSIAKQTLETLLSPPAAVTFLPLCISRPGANKRLAPP